MQAGEISGTWMMTGMQPWSTDGMMRTPQPCCKARQASWYTVLVHRTLMYARPPLAYGNVMI
jgi:hypothetical protein